MTQVKSHLWHVNIFRQFDILEQRLYTKKIVKKTFHFWTYKIRIAITLKVGALLKEVIGINEPVFHIIIFYMT